MSLQKFYSKLEEFVKHWLDLKYKNLKLIQLRFRLILADLRRGVVEFADGAIQPLEALLVGGVVLESQVF